MNNKLIFESERIDDLQLGDLKIIQNPEWFCFGIDAVLLSHFASLSIKKDFKVVDFCTGNGIIPLLLSEKTSSKIIYGIEILECVSNLAERNIKLNKLENKIKIINKDIKNIKEVFEKGSIDYITCNPPYKENFSGLKNENEIIKIARHEICCNLEDIILSAEYLLKPGGKIALVHRPDRLVDLIYLMKKNKIEPKKLRFIHPYASKAATMILVEGTKHGGKNLVLEPPLYVYNENREYTEEINQIYGRI